MATLEGPPVCWICQCGPGDVAAHEDLQVPVAAALEREARTRTQAEAGPLLHALDSPGASPVWSETGASAEPLVQDRCLCVGVMARVHLTCLNEWVLQRGHKTCNLCGTDYQIIAVIETADGVMTPAEASSHMPVPKGLLAGWWIYAQYTQRWLARALLVVFTVALLALVPLAYGIALRGVYLDVLLIPGITHAWARLSPHTSASYSMATAPRLDPDPRVTWHTQETLCPNTTTSLTLRCVLAPWLSMLTPPMRDRSGNAGALPVALLQCFASGLLVFIAFHAAYFSWRHFSEQVSQLELLHEEYARERADIAKLPPPARRLARLTLSFKWWSRPEFRPHFPVAIMACISCNIGWLPACLCMGAAWWVTCAPNTAIPPLVMEAIYTGPPEEEDEEGRAVDATALLQTMRGSSPRPLTIVPRSPSATGSRRGTLLGRRRRRALAHQRRARYGACRAVVVVRGAGCAFVQRELVRVLHLAVCPWLVGVCAQAATSGAVDWTLPLWGGSAAVVWGPSRLCAALPPLSRAACVVLTPSLDVLTVCGHWLAGAAVLWGATRLVVGPVLGSVMAPRVVQDWLGFILAHPLDVAGVDACVAGHWVRGNVRRERGACGSGGGARARAWLLDTVVHVMPREVWRVCCCAAVCSVLLGVPSGLLCAGRAVFATVVPASAQYDSVRPLPLWTLGHHGSHRGGLADHTAALHNSSFVGTARSLHATFTQWAVARHGTSNALSLWGLLLTVTSLAASLALTVLMIARRWLWSSMLLLDHNGLAWSAAAARPANVSSTMSRHTTEEATRTNAAMGPERIAGASTGAWMLPGGWQTWLLVVVSAAWCVLYIDLCPTTYYLLKYGRARMLHLSQVVLRLPAHAGRLFVAPAHAEKVERWMAKVRALHDQGAVYTASLDALCPDALSLFFGSPAYDTTYVRVVNRDHNGASLRRYVARSKELQRRLRRTVTQLETQEKRVRQLQKKQQASNERLAHLQRALAKRVGANAVSAAAARAAPSSPPTSRATPAPPAAQSPSPPPLAAPTTPQVPPPPHRHRHRHRTPRSRGQRWWRAAAANAWRRVRLLCFLLVCLVCVSLACFGPLVCVMTLLADVVPHGLLLILLSLAVWGTVGNMAIAYVASLLLACFPTFVLLFGFMHYASFLHGVVRAVMAEEEAVRETLEALYKTRRIVGPHDGHGAMLAQRLTERAVREAAQSPALVPQTSPTVPDPLSHEAGPLDGVATAPPLPTVHAEDARDTSPATGAHADGDESADDSETE